VGGTRGPLVKVHGHYNLLATDGRLSDYGYWGCSAAVCGSSQACHKGARPTLQDFFFQEGGEPVSNSSQLSSISQLRHSHPFSLLVCYVLADDRDMHPSVSYCNLREMLTAKCAGLTI